MIWRVIKRSRILPLVAFGGPLFAIAFVQYRWLEELRGRSRMIEAQQNREAALRAVSQLEDTTHGARLQTLPAVVHADITELNLEPMQKIFDEGLQAFPYVDRFFVWANPAPPGDTLFYFPEEGRFRTAPELVRRLPSEVWEIYGGSLRWAEFGCVAGSNPCQIVVHRILTDDDSSLDGLVGFTVDLTEFGREFLPAFYRDTLLPNLRTMLDRENVPLAVFDESSTPVFSTGSNSMPSLSSSAVEFPVSFAAPTEGPPGESRIRHWRIEVGESFSGVEQILKHGALANLTIVGVGILVLALGTMLIARSSRREAKLSDLKSRFMSGISHELKTPLAMIRLYSEMLELGRVPNDTERTLFYRTVRQQAEIMADMLEEILDFSRLESEQQGRRREICQLQDILEEAAEIHASRDVGHALTMHVEPNLPQIECDRYAMVRAVYNLMDNAWKYSDPTTPIEVRAGRQNGFLALEVLDRGIGISPDDLPHVFERFYRGHTPEGIKGTGLGLSIVETVARAHGGKVEVESRVGEGSRFTILIPAGDEVGAA